MINALERIATDPYIRRIMEEQEFDKLEVDLLNDTITAQGNTITVLQSNNAALQAQIAEYQRIYGNINVCPN